ncbi:MAG: phosphopyruvate hydratase [Gammaproteobacteria bacterium]|nr:phosphopyruvate hydratase [Gammaproteobacteria bacterium]
MFKVTSVNSRQILDSRGNPTVEAEIIVDDNNLGRGSVPSGASTGALEALELRDNNRKIFLGKSVYKAIDNINTQISKSVLNQSYTQELFDKALIDLDNTPNKERLGANAILALSIAFANACSRKLNKPLYQTISKSNKYSLPVPMMNVINGGAHANNGLNFQEFMIIPIGFEKYSDSLRAGVEIFHVLKEKIEKLNMSTSVGDEGGFAPQIESNIEALDLILDAINDANYVAGKHVYLGLDVASSEFYVNGNYMFENKELSSTDFITYLANLCDKYPIISIEDGMSEDDWDGWSALTKKLNDKVQLVGDDVFVTNKDILKKGIDKNIANSILIKLNQIGTITETLETIDLAKQNGYTTIISHRSGETEDVTIADLSVSTSAGQIKTGSLSRTDRNAKYNQLIRIEENVKEYNPQKVFNRWL